MAQSSRRGSGGMLRSAPVGVTSSSHFCSASVFSQPASAFASSSAAFSSHTTATTSLFQRSASPTRVNLYSSNTAANSVRFSFDHRSIAAVPGRDRPVVKKQSPLPQKKTCMCSPTTHPGSFRCSLHKGMGSAVSSSSNRLNARRSAMTNSLVRIGTVEGDWVKRALAALIRPSSHQQRRRASFRPRPSRLSMMSKAEE